MGERKRTSKSKSRRKEVRGNLGFWVQSTIIERFLRIMGGI